MRALSQRESDGHCHHHGDRLAIQQAWRESPLPDRVDGRGVEQRDRPEHFYVAYRPILSDYRFENHNALNARGTRDWWIGG